jgi:hypothetical protein
LQSCCLCRDLLSEEKHNEDLIMLQTTKHMQAFNVIQQNKGCSSSINEDLIAINIAITPWGNIDIPNSLFCFVSISCLSITSICLCSSLGCMYRTKLESKSKFNKKKKKNQKRPSCPFQPTTALISAYSWLLFWPIVGPFFWPIVGPFFWPLWYCLKTQA